MMKRFIWYAYILLIASGFAYSQESGSGLGIKVGEPSGINLKLWLNSVNAVSITTGYSLIQNDRSLYISCDYLYHIEDIIKSEERMPVYYGFGGRLLTKEREDASFGVRGVMGVAWYGRDIPVDVFFEIAPVFKLIPSTSMDFEAGIGTRYFFH
ncbi:MAG: hypothetical protein WCJ01_10810 [Ignavibacteria bacterium]